MFCKIGFLRNLTKFTGKNLCQSLFFNKVAGLRPATLFKKRFWHKCFPVNFAKFLRTPFLTEHLRWLLLTWEWAFTKILDQQVSLDFPNISRELLQGEVYIFNIKKTLIFEIFRNSMKIFRGWIQLPEAVSRRCSVKKNFLKYFAKFTGIHLCHSLFFNKVAGLRLQTSDFLWNLWNFQEQLFFKEHLRWLLRNYVIVMNTVRHKKTAWVSSLFR